MSSIVTLSGGNVPFKNTECASHGFHNTVLLSFLRVLIVLTVRRAAPIILATTSARGRRQSNDHKYNYNYHYSMFVFVEQTSSSSVLENRSCDLRPFDLRTIVRPRLVNTINVIGETVFTRDLYRCNYL